MTSAQTYLKERASYLTSRALRLVASEASGLQRAVYVLALSALVSALLALLRDRLLAHVFGAGLDLDLYYAAFRIPDFLYVATGALVSVYILIPELARRASEEQKRYIDTVLAGFSLLSIALCAVAALIAPTLLRLMFPDFVAEGYLPLLTFMTRIMLMQPILLGFSNIFAAVTQSRHRYLLYSLTGLLYNLGIIIGTVVFYPLIGLSGLAWGIVLGALMHVGIQVPSILSDGFLARVPRIHDMRALVDTILVSVPRALALSMGEIAENGIIIFAGLLPAGSISIFTLAYNLQAVPLSIIGASYSVAAFPSLAAALMQGKRDEFVAFAATAARHVLFWSLPATALIIVLRAHVVRVIYGSGAFDWTDTRLTAAAFAIMAVSLAAQGIMLLLIRAYYAAGRTFLPFFLSLFSAMATVALSAAAVGAFHDAWLVPLAEALLRVSGVPGASVLALAVVYAVISVATTIALILHFEHRFSGFLRRVWRAWLESLLAAITSGAAAYVMLNVLGPITINSTLLSVFLRGLSGGVVGIVFAGLSYYVLGSNEYREVADAVAGKFRRMPLTPSIVSAAEETI